MYSLKWTVSNGNISAFNSFSHVLIQNVCFLKILKAVDQSDQVTQLYIYLFLYDNFFNLQSIFLKIRETQQKTI